MIRSTASVKHLAILIMLEFLIILFLIVVYIRIGAPLDIGNERMIIILILGWLTHFHELYLLFRNELFDVLTENTLLLVVVIHKGLSHTENRMVIVIVVLIVIVKIRALISMREIVKVYSLGLP